MQETDLFARNQVCLTGTLDKTESIRYTPAGIATLRVELKHKSLQVEADIKRTVELRMPSVAIGEIAEKVSRLKANESYTFTGFMAAKGLKDSSLLFHITGYSTNE